MNQNKNSNYTTKNDNKINTDPKDKKINELEAKIVALENKNIELTKENGILKEKVNKLTFELSKIKNSEKNLKINQNDDKDLYKKYIILNEKCEELNKQLNRYPIKLKENEKLISVIFTSVDQNIHYSIVCKNTNTINNLEAELYSKFPEYSETENYFLCKGARISKFKTFDHYHIDNGDIIILNRNEWILIKIK